VRTVAYAEHHETVLDLHVPAGEPSGTTVVLLHGGFWRDRYRRDLMDPLVPSLLAAGHVVVNLEYRRVGGAGGWPTTLVDVADGIDALADLDEVDAERVVVVGHSAGGHLAVWAASRHRLRAGAPGAEPRVRPRAAVSLAGVVDLAAAAPLSDGAVAELLGEDVPGPRHAIADPATLVPIGLPVTLVHGSADEDVPVEQSQRYLAAAAAAGDPVRMVVGPGDHYSVIDPLHDRWADVQAAVSRAG
jgi:acetyl esterase/lipase